MATVTAAVLLIGGLIAIIVLIIAVIYPEWFAHENKSMARVTTRDLRKEKDESNKEP